MKIHVFFKLVNSLSKILVFTSQSVYLPARVELRCCPFKVLELKTLLIIVLRVVRIVHSTARVVLQLFQQVGDLLKFEIKLMLLFFSSNQRFTQVLDLSVFIRGFKSCMVSSSLFGSVSSFLLLVFFFDMLDFVLIWVLCVEIGSPSARIVLGISA